MIVNFNNIEENKKFEPIDAGEYDVIIVNSTIDKSKKGDAMVVLEYKILGIEEERKLKDFIVLTNEISLGKLKTVFRLKGIDMTNDVDVAFIISSAQLIGFKTKAFIDVESYINEYKKEIISNKIKYLVDKDA